MKYLPNKEEYNKYWVCDVECNGLNPTEIFCICLENLGTGEIKEFYGDNLNDFNNYYNSNMYLCGHNFISFDLPVLNNLLLSNISNASCIDTLVLDYLYSPKISGGHSLEAVGNRFGDHKIVHEDWTKFSQEMLLRCRKDVKLTKRLYLALITKMKAVGFSEESCKLEHDIRIVINEQERNGFRFDRQRAINFVKELRSRQVGLTRDIQELFPATYEPIKTYKYRTTKDGDSYESFKRHQKDYERLEFNDSHTEYTVFVLKEFDIASPQQRVQRLLSLGWEPTVLTKKGNPQADEDSVIKFAEKKKDPRIAAIAEWLVLQGRASMVEGWIKETIQHDSQNATTVPEKPIQADLGVEQYEDTSDSLKLLYGLPRGSQEEWYIHGRVATCGAQSRRMTHWKPNTANIPSEANGAKYGKECRELWISRGRSGVSLEHIKGIEDEKEQDSRLVSRQRAKREYKLVGVDAKSLQMRLFLHYINAPEWLISLYLERDPHQYNADSLSKTLGFEVSRGGGGAKTIYYALIFGGQDKKLGSILKKGPRVGKLVRECLYEITPGLLELSRSAESQFKVNNGWLPCLDGGFVRCPSPHVAINYLIQPAEAIVMKKASTILYSYYSGNSRQFDALKVVDVHDEWQFDVREDEAEDFGKLAADCIRQSGEHFELHVGLEGSYLIGDNCSQTH